MNKFTFTLLLSAFASASVVAQVLPEVVGTVDSVDGLVTASQGSTLGNVGTGQKIVDGASLVTSANGSAVIIVKGCRISMGPNKTIMINSKLPCEKQIASIKSISTVATDGGGPGNPAGMAALGVAGVAAFVNYRQRGNASGS